MSPVSSAISIHYQAIDLADSTAGEDLWQYRYTVSDYIFAENTGFVLFFDHTLYASLQNPAPFVHADWDILVTQPIAFIPEKGTYDALALLDSPSLINEFSLNFIWLGQSIPSSQAFELYDVDFNSLASGNTLNVNASIPEPSTLFLLSFALLFGIPSLNSLENKS